MISFTTAHGVSLAIPVHVSYAKKNVYINGENNVANQTTDVTQVLTERGTRYGKFSGHANVTQDLKKVIRHHLKQREKKLTDEQIEALEMIAHKIGRIINGDPNYADSWVDIAGYAKLVSDSLEGVER